MTRGESGNSTVVRISADDHYKLYVNGELVAQGPAPAFIEHYYYNTVDITPYLHDGDNTLAVHVYYQGLLNRVWGSADGRCALAADVLCLRSNGTVASRFEPSWRYTVSDAFGMGDTVGYETQFLENFDSNKWNEDWAQERNRRADRRWLDGRASRFLYAGAYRLLAAVEPDAFDPLRCDGRCGLSCSVLSGGKRRFGSL